MISKISVFKKKKIVSYSFFQQHISWDAEWTVSSLCRIYPSCKEPIGEKNIR